MRVAGSLNVLITGEFGWQAACGVSGGILRAYFARARVAVGSLGPPIVYIRYCGLSHMVTSGMSILNPGARRGQGARGIVDLLLGVGGLSPLLCPCRWALSAIQVPMLALQALVCPWGRGPVWHLAQALVWVPLGAALVWAGVGAGALALARCPAPRPPAGAGARLALGAWWVTGALHAMQWHIIVALPAAGRARPTPGGAARLGALARGAAWQRLGGRLWWAAGGPGPLRSPARLRAKWAALALPRRMAWLAVTALDGLIPRRLGRGTNWAWLALVDSHLPPAIGGTGLPLLAGPVTRWALGPLALAGARARLGRAMWALATPLAALLPALTLWGPLRGIGRQRLRLSLCHWSALLGGGPGGGQVYR